jgi:hypothetical protein
MFAEGLLIVQQARLWCDAQNEKTAMRQFSAGEVEFAELPSFQDYSQFQKIRNSLFN